MSSPSNGLKCNDLNSIVFQYPLVTGSRFCSSRLPIETNNLGMVIKEIFDYIDKETLRNPFYSYQAIICFVTVVLMTSAPEMLYILTSALSEPYLAKQLFFWTSEPRISQLSQPRYDVKRDYGRRNTSFPYRTNVLKQYVIKNLIVPIVNKRKLIILIVTPFITIKRQLTFYLPKYDFNLTIFIIFL